MSVTSDFQSWDEVRDWLASGESVSYHTWYFSEHGMTCGDLGCCDESFHNIDDALESVKYYAHTIERVERW
jgi:hypothetical protein